MSSPLTDLHDAIEEKNVGKMLSILYENPLLLTARGEYTATGPLEDPVTVIEHLCRLIKKEYNPETRFIDPAILQMLHLINMIAPSEISNTNSYCKDISTLFPKHLETGKKTASHFKINPENLPKLKAAARALERERIERAEGRAKAIANMDRYAAARPAERAAENAREMAAEIRIRDEALARERAGGAGARRSEGNGEVIPPAPVPTGPRPSFNLSHLSDEDIFEFLRDNLDEEEFFKITNHREYLQNRPNLLNGGACRTMRQKKQHLNRKTKRRNRKTKNRNRKTTNRR